MDKILFIIPAYYTNRPQAVRFRNILPHLVDKFEIHLLYPSDIRKNLDYIKDEMNIHEIHGSLFGHLINPYYYNNFYFPNNKIIKVLRKVGRFIFRSILFPDLFIVEMKNLKNNVKELIGKYEFKAIIVSCAPFTLMKLGSFIKATNPNIKWIVDLGDPFYKNDINKYLIQKLFAKPYEAKYLKYLDKLIVTNYSTFEHYKNIFFNSIPENKIKIITHGTIIQKVLSEKMEINWSSEIIISYIGIFYKTIREPFELYKAIIEFNKLDKSKKILLNIYGVTPPYFQKLPDIKSKNYIKFNGIINHEKVNGIYSKSDFVLLIDNAYGLQTPGKVFELIATGKPILFLYSNPNSATLSILRAYEGAILIKNDKLNIVNVFNKVFNKNSFSFSPNFNLKPYLWTNISKDFYNLIKE